jgi:chromosome segregation ATPase
MEATYNAFKSNNSRGGAGADMSDIDKRVKILEASAKSAADFSKISQDGKLDANEILALIQNLQSDILSKTASLEDLDALRTQVDNNSKNIKTNEQETTLAHDKCESLDKRVTDLEGKVRENSVDLEGLQKQLVDINKDLMAKLEMKLDCDIFDEELQKLRNMIASLGSNMDGGSSVTAAVASGPSIDTKLLTQLKALPGKVSDLESKVNILLVDMKRHNSEDYPGKIKSLSAALFKKADLDKTTAYLSQHDSSIKELESKIADLMAAGLSAPTSGNNDNSVSDL